MSKALDDYSKEFQSNLKLEDFSYDVIVKLLRLYAQLYIGIDGFWYLAVMERNGNDEALACDFLAWERGNKYEMRKITEALNIRGNDLIALMKTLQISPWFQHIKYRFDVSNDESNITLTVTYCPTLDALEKEGKGREVQICGTFEPVSFRNCASFFNPNIQVEPTTPLPRKRKDDICCQWLFSLKR